MARMGASLFGKLPTTLDFVRIHHDSQAAIAFDTWTQQAIQELARTNTAWPAMYVRFLFAPGSPASGQEALVGVMVDSRDRAGRKFPVAIFSALPVSAIARGFAALPLAWEPFLDGAQALLGELASLSREDLTARLDALPLPAAGALAAQGRTLASMLETRSAADFAAGVQIEPLELRRACETLLAATRPVRSEPGDRPAVLDCPLGEPADAVMWLALAQRSLAWSSSVPSFFWSAPADAPGRLLLALGAPPPALPAWLSDSARRHARLTPLHAGPRLQAPAPLAGDDVEGPGLQSPSPLAGADVGGPPESSTVDTESSEQVDASDQTEERAAEAPSVEGPTLEQLFAELVP